MSMRERVLRARQALLNGSSDLPYFERRNIEEKVVREAWIGSEDGALMYPCIARDGGLLAVHFKSKARDAKGKRRQWWEGHADDLPPKGHGKKPDEPAKVIPFGMETLKDLERGSLVILTCGEEDALSLRQVGFTAVSQPGAGLLEPAYAREFAGFEVVVFFDAGEEKEARKDALKLKEAGAQEVRVVGWPPNDPNGADINSRLVDDPESFKHWAAGMIMAARSLSSADAGPTNRKGEPDGYGGGAEPGLRSSAKGLTQADILIGFADEAQVFHTPDSEAHATIETDGHMENWPVKSRKFSQFLLRRFYKERGRAPSAQALTDARATIAARAVFDGPEWPVHVRVAGHDGAVYVDLANDTWEAVEITSAGKRVVPSNVLPVKFVRKDNAGPLPYPVPDGSIDDLRPFVNVRTEEDFVLIVGWMVGALSPDGPYPILVLQGEQGSAKSTTVRVIRSIGDPAVEPLRAPPRDERDLAIAASGNWTPALNNLSGLRPWLSDAVCRLATGGGFATRELYSDDREILFSHKRPVILNGIDSLAVAGDLRDRSLIIELPPIPPDKMRTERAFYRELEQVRPKVLGALLDAVSAALRNRETTELEDLPRLADFALWVTAAEEALPWASGKFIEAYTGNRAEANEFALDSDTVAATVRRLMKDRSEWTGTSTELLAKLGALVDEDVKRSQSWPKAPNALSNRMKRLAPDLREVGIEYGDGRDSGGSRRRRKYLKKVPEKDRPDRSHPSDGRGNPAHGGDDPGTTGSDTGRSQSEKSKEMVPQEGRTNGRIRDDRDGRDDDLRPFSDREPPIKKALTQDQGGREDHRDQDTEDEGSGSTLIEAHWPSCIHDVPGGCWLCRTRTE